MVLCLLFLVVILEQFLLSIHYRAWINPNIIRPWQIFSYCIFLIFNVFSDILIGNFSDIFMSKWSLELMRLLALLFDCWVLRILLIFVLTNTSWLLRCMFIVIRHISNVKLSLFIFKLLNFVLKPLYLLIYFCLVFFILPWNRRSTFLNLIYPRLIIWFIYSFHFMLFTIGFDWIFTFHLIDSLASSSLTYLLVSSC
jgi:hypothetical protein